MESLDVVKCSLRVSFVSYISIYQAFFSTQSGGILRHRASVAGSFWLKTLSFFQDLLEFFQDLLEFFRYFIEFFLYFEFMLSFLVQKYRLWTCKLSELAKYSFLTRKRAHSYLKTYFKVEFCQKCLRCIEPKIA